MSKDVMAKAIELVQSQLDNYKKLSGVKLELLTPKDILRWYTPKTPAEYHLFESIRAALYDTTDYEEQLESELNQVKDANGTLEDQLEYAEQQVRELENKIQLLKDENEKLEEQIVALQDEINDLDEVIAEMIQ